ncbi:MAG TPA: tetratricopeptide repeat protein, partial [Ferruginibacter sp.]|nr:tetratricopeptide repeat protein [Ferruginibacter sp.]
MKKKLIIIGLFIFLGGILYAQPKPKQKEKVPTQKEIEKMMEDAMKAEGMSKEEMVEMKKAMKEATGAVAEMKKAGINVYKSSTDVLKIPVKQTGLLQQIPIVQTQQQLDSYFSLLLAECKKNMPSAMVAKIDGMISSLNGNENELAALPITLFLNRNIKAAVYAAMKVSQVKGRSPLVQNNSAFVLLQSGYPGKAIPVFKYLQQKFNTADFNNNLAQCYLSLGDKEEAKKYFRIGLSKNPNSSEMHCGLGLIFSEEGNVSEAILHITESLKNGYSLIAEGLVKKYKIKVKFSDIKTKAPEYFNPQKFKPASAAATMEDMPRVEAERAAAEERYRQAYNRNEAFHQKLSAAQKDQNLGTMLQANLVNMGNTPFARKAWYM